tara:strand:- start:61 stop:318 length:258 start_codon:yes stop_codon:yes gene_type:complete
MGWGISLFMGIWALFGAFDVVSILFGKVVAVLSLVIFPVPLALAPWYLGFAYGDWTLLFITYGALPIFWLFIGISSVFLQFGDKD